MSRKVMLVAAAGAFALASVAHAVPPIAGIGTVGTCSLSGKASIKPGLVFGGTLTPVKTKFVGKLTGCSGGSGDGANVISGILKATINSTGVNDCAALAVVGLDAFTATIKWKTAPHTQKVLASTTNIAATPAGNIVIGATGITITMNGTNAAGGSFAGNAVTAVAVTDETATTFATACAAKGLKKFNFTGLNGPSTITD
jgi:hypothetical protein